jgi:PKHD-type hydroxylase
MFTSPIIRIGSLNPEAVRALQVARATITFRPNALSPGAVGDRISESAEIPLTEITAPLYENLNRLFGHFNSAFNVTVDGVEEAASIVRYRTGGEVGWHLDCGEHEGARRKLSISVQLTDPSTYSGGNLEFAGAATHPLGRDMYAAIGFPAFLAHRVTPVTHGIREALVVWAHGPKYV